MSCRWCLFLIKFIRFGGLLEHALVVVGSDVLGFKVGTLQDLFPDIARKIVQEQLIASDVL